MSLLDELKLSYKQGTYLIKLVYLNLAIYLAVALVEVFFALSGNGSPNFLNWISLPASLGELATKPWTLFTYMFVHKDFLHVLFNVLWLYWFGRIFLQYLDQKRLLSLYLVGGFIGGFTYIIAYNTFPVFQNFVASSQLMGASAAVIAIVVACATYVPNHELHLMFLGPVRIKYIAIFSVLSYVIGLKGNNAGGHFAHLGGALWGYVYMLQYKKGRNISAGFDRFLDKIFSLFKPKKNLHVKYKKYKSKEDKIYNVNNRRNQERVDEILDKITKSGYNSLSKEEKDILFQMENKK